MKSILRILAVSLLSFFALTGVAFAATDGTRSELPAGQTVNSLYARAAETVTVHGDINGDVWVAGQDVEVDGKVRGNVYAAGNKVVIKGEVSGSVHAAASTVEIDGTIGGSVYAAGSEVTLRDSSKVGGAVALAGSKVQLGGDIAQQAYAAGNTLDMSARVGQSVNLAGSDISLNDQAKVAGDLTYRSENEARIANDRAISGSLKHDEVKKTERNPVREKIATALFGLILNIVIGLCLVLWGTRILKVTDTLLTADLPNAVLKGIAFMVLTPLALLFIAITLIGLPLAAIGTMVYLSLLILAPALVSYSLGRYILVITTHKDSKKAPGKFQAILAGSLAFTIISLVPIVGGLAEFLLCAAGVGAVIARGFKPLQTRS
jgi:cytoskeletal protein CcmA (bactofilin family)